VAEDENLEPESASVTLQTLLSKLTVQLSSAVNHCHGQHGLHAPYPASPGNKNATSPPPVKPPPLSTHRQDHAMQDPVPHPNGLAGAHAANHAELVLDSEKEAILVSAIFLMTSKHATPILAQVGAHGASGQIAVLHASKDLVPEHEHASMAMWDKWDVKAIQMKLKTASEVAAHGTHGHHGVNVLPLVLVVSETEEEITPVNWNQRLIPKLATQIQDHSVTGLHGALAQSPAAEEPKRTKEPSGALVKWTLPAPLATLTLASTVHGVHGQIAQQRAV